MILYDHFLHLFLKTINMMNIYYFYIYIYILHSLILFVCIIGTLIIWTKYFKIIIFIVMILYK